MTDAPPLSDWLLGFWIKKIVHYCQKCILAGYCVEGPILAGNWSLCGGTDPGHISGASPALSATQPPQKATALASTFCPSRSLSFGSGDITSFVSESVSSFMSADASLPATPTSSATAAVSLSTASPSSLSFGGLIRSYNSGSGLSVPPALLQFCGVELGQIIGSGPRTHRWWHSFQRCRTCRC
jgi:hypothetical protein